MSFQEIERRFAELDGQYRNGSLTSDQFNAALATLMTKDEQGRWWTKRRGSGAWCVYDGTGWQAGNPESAGAPVAVAQPAVATAEVATAEPSHTPTAPDPAQVVTPPAVAAPQPAAQRVQTGNGMGAMAFLYYALAIIPIIGLVLWLSFRKSTEPAKRKIAPILLAISLCSFVLGIVLNIVAAG